MTQNKKNIASLSLDLDNKWSYLKTHGDSNWEHFPSYFDLVVPRFLELLEERGIKITVFIVGQDAAIQSNHASLRMIADAGHEIGNHSFHHEPWLHLYSPEQLEEEFTRSEQAIYEATGKRTVGFRGPGFSLSDQVLKTLIRRGYEYDCSTFPTYLGPLARAYYFMKSRLSSEQREERKALFGSFTDGFQSNKPFMWQDGNHELLEIPVTTMPIFKVPIYASYLLYLGRFSPLLAKTYYWKALKLCRLFGVQPSILLHPLDFLGENDEKDLAFFPAMDQPAEKKLKLMAETIDMLHNDFEILTMKDHADRIRQTSRSHRSVMSAPTGLAEA